MRDFTDFKEHKTSIHSVVSPCCRKEETLVQPKTVYHEKPPKSETNGLAHGEVNEMTPLGADVGEGFQPIIATPPKERSLPSFVLVLGKVFALPILRSHAFRLVTELLPFLNPLLIK